MYQKVLLGLVLALFCASSVAQQEDKDLYGYHVELCKDCTLEEDFMYAAQLQIDVDSVGQMINKTVVVGNLATRVVKAYRVSKVIDQNYSQTTIKPIATPAAAAEAFSAVETLFVSWETQQGKPIDRYNPELIIDIPSTINGVNTSSYHIIKGSPDAASKVSNYLRMRLLASFAAQLQQRIILLLRMAEFVVKTNFEDGTSVSWILSNPWESYLPFQLIQGTEMQNGVPIQPPSRYQTTTTSLGYYMSPASLGTVVLKCRPYTIKSSSGEVFTGSICWYQKP